MAWQAEHSGLGVALTNFRDSIISYSPSFDYKLYVPAGDSPQCMSHLGIPDGRDPNCTP